MSDSLTQQTKILRAVKDAGPFGVENWKLSRIALCYSKRLQELREDGYNIVAERQRLKNGKLSNTWKYILIGEGDPLPKKPKTNKGNEVLRELMIAKSKGRFACYTYISERIKEIA